MILCLCWRSSLQERISLFLLLGLMMGCNTLSDDRKYVMQLATLGASVINFPVDRCNFHSIALYMSCDLEVFSWCLKVACGGDNWSHSFLSPLGGTEMLYLCPSFHPSFLPSLVHHSTLTNTLLHLCPSFLPSVLSSVPRPSQHTYYYSVKTTYNIYFISDMYITTLAADFCKQHG